MLLNNYSFVVVLMRCRVHCLACAIHALLRAFHVCRASRRVLLARVSRVNHVGHAASARDDKLLPLIIT
jgi:hypothetical protein